MYTILKSRLKGMKEEMKPKQTQFCNKDWKFPTIVSTKKAAGIRVDFFVC